MNKSKAEIQANIWLNQKPMPQELDPDIVWDVLESLGFESKGKNSDHTTIRWSHKSLLNNESYFKFGIVSLSVGHSKGQKKVLRVDSVKKLINSLTTYFEYEKK